MTSVHSCLILLLVCVSYISALSLETEPPCPPLPCFLHCRDDYKTVNGCPICQCNDAGACPAVGCLRHCLNGFKIINGCPSCTCNDVVCLFHCRLSCARSSTTPPTGCDCTECPDSPPFTFF